jgi:hypothetical protein
MITPSQIAAIKTRLLQSPAEESIPLRSFAMTISDD